MSLKQVPYYELYCDGCGAQFEYDTIVAMKEAQDILMSSHDSDWTFFAEQHFCPNCGVPECACGHGWGEHDYQVGVPCESCECETYRQA